MKKKYLQDNYPFKGWSSSIMEVKTTFEAREMASAERVDFIMSHLEGPAKKEVQMYSKKDRSNPDFLLDVLAQAFGEKRSSSQFLKLFYEQRKKESEKLQAYLYSFNELLKNATKADPKTAPDPEKTLQDRFADNVRDPFLQKELKKFIRKCNPSFLDLREEALHWSEEEERPQRVMPRFKKYQLPQLKALSAMLVPPPPLWIRFWMSL